MSDTALARAVAAAEGLVVDEYEPGARLPGEAELAQRFGVSRLTLREALKVLAGRGLVELGRGRRPVVREPDGSVLSGYFAVAMRRDPHALLELVEIRESLEVLAAGKAARRSGRATAAVLETALERMAGAVDLGEPERERRFHEADAAFHEALALAAGSRMLAFVLEGFEDSLKRSFAASYRGHFARGGDFAEVLGAHRAVVEAVRAHDVPAAEQAMRAHLRQVEKDLRAAIEAAA
ncbi:FadR/GntR family transcriptional regulator [Jiangella mangrovi]|uniref:GntR family transcriptional repressor for pyruvate dehydrogenase complex n=1 Tax=Jiangella mangrovi TaxID=1524084 RepID=A0A7W9GWE2_9ACTN|nr:FCD domain-containing protein [Jiangella mangrovi]MBB5791284.1 GntR family transcriptional repressor for pyruvate dehydrogenase complex [Jiangella mangrovi]